MPTAADTLGTAFQDSTVVLLARIVDSDGEPVTPPDISDVHYWVRHVDPCRPNNLTVVEGHDGVSLTPGQVLFETLQTDSIWTADATGYNFRHEVDISTEEAFPDAGAHYQVRYELTPTSGAKIVTRFLIRAI